MFHQFVSALAAIVGCSFLFWLMYAVVAATEGERKLNRQAEWVARALVYPDEDVLHWMQHPECNWCDWQRERPAIVLKAMITWAHYLSSIEGLDDEAWALAVDAVMDDRELICRFLSPEVLTPEETNTFEALRFMVPRHIHCLSQVRKDQILAAE